MVQSWSDMSIFWVYVMHSCPKPSAEPSRRTKDANQLVLLWTKPIKVLFKSPKTYIYIYWIGDDQHGTKVHFYHRLWCALPHTLCSSQLPSPTLELRSPDSYLQLQKGSVRLGSAEEGRGGVSRSGSVWDTVFTVAGFIGSRDMLCTYEGGGATHLNRLTHIVGGRAYRWAIWTAGGLGGRTHSVQFVSTVGPGHLYFFLFFTWHSFQKT